MEQKKIITSYFDDIDKYATISQRQKIKDCYDSLPRQLAKEYTQFKYSVVKTGATSVKYDNSLNWLIDAGMVGKCNNVSTPAFPLAAYIIEDEYKIYATDIGILSCMYGFETQKNILLNTIVGLAKGGIYENVIFEMFNKKGYTLRYYKKTGRELEIEFLLEKESRVIPVEVKSKNGATKSLNSFIEDFSPLVAYKLINGNVGVSGIKVTLPHYMGMLL